MKRYIEFIKESKEDFTLEEQWWDAVVNNDLNKIKSLIELGFDINKQNKFGKTALMICRHEIKKLLLERPEIKVNIQDNDGNTALMYTHYLNTIDLLLSHPDIDVNIQNNDGDTALILAPNQSEVLKYLEFKNIDITIENKDGFNFMDYIMSEWSGWDSEYFLKDYFFQLKILKNGREDIIEFLNRYNLVNVKIKKENPDLFKAADWGLI